MLRRLGYTEVEIRQALGDYVETHESRETITETHTETKTVELEYNHEAASEIEDFEPVTPSRQGGFMVQEVEEPEPEEEPEEEWEYVEEPIEEFEQVEEEEEWEDVEDIPRTEFQELDIPEEPEEEEVWEEPATAVHFQELEIAPPAIPEPAPGKRVRLKVIRAGSAEEAADIARSRGDRVVHTVPVTVNGGQPTQDSWENPTFEHDDENSAVVWDAAEDPQWDEGSEWDAGDDWESTETQEQAVEATPEHAVDPWDVTNDQDEWADDNWEAEAAPAQPVEESWQVDAPEPAAPAPAAAAAPTDYFVRNEYILHKREAKMPSGKTETLYFFAKGLSESGTPCPLPAGYKVSEHPGSKLPYIAKEDA
ncbi:MAG: hypothetical protein ACPHK8_05275 [Thermoplasmatota archaeon]